LSVCEKDFGKGIFFNKFSVFGKKKKKSSKITFLISPNLGKYYLSNIKNCKKEKKRKGTDYQGFLCNFVILKKIQNFPKKKKH
jgi:hypothetical protein